MDLDIVYIVHVLIVIGVMSFPFWPKEYAKIGIWIPFLISLIWVFFDGCPLTRYHADRTDSMTMQIYKKFMPNITQEGTSHINTALMVGITLLGHYRLCTPSAIAV